MLVEMALVKECKGLFVREWGCLVGVRSLKAQIVCDGPDHCIQVYDAHGTYGAVKERTMDSLICHMVWPLRETAKCIWPIS